VLVVSVIV